ncbi:hypothetical protein F5Y11DRAFT_363744 [Daldinia sp. FL1419]|nr:hypothetical protein F5Y11DRAFT_363744 [Daldinia sp. FL1419]
MCQLWSQEYAECHHVSRNLIHCPTYYKQQSEANGFFGHCGRVIPHYGEPALYCSACTVRNEQLRGRQVGDGALRVHHPRERDEHQYRSREHRERYQDPNGGSYNGYKSHEQQGVWIPGLYYQPENLAKRDPYSRSAGKARPVSQVKPPPRPQAPTKTHQIPEKKWDKYQPSQPSQPSSTREHDRGYYKSHDTQPPRKHERKEEKSSRSHENRSRVAVKEVSGYSQPHHSKDSSRDRSRKPVWPEPERHRRGREERTQEKSTRKPPRRPPRRPSPESLPPTPPPKDPPRKRLSHIRHIVNQERPLPPTPQPTPPLKEYPRLRRKRGQVYKIARTPTPTPTPPPPPRPPEAPLPEYLVYLNAQRFAAEHHPSTSPTTIKSPTYHPAPPRPPPLRSRNHLSGSTTKSSLLQRMSPIRILDTGSDESFVCKDARMISMSGQPF